MLGSRGEIGPARDMLRADLDLAVRCGPRPVAERPRQQLIAAGARPRRPALAGAASLTAAERRVSQLASMGLSNREIAQALFVTVKTVKLHLTNSYRRLAGLRATRTQEHREGAFASQAGLSWWTRTGDEIVVTIRVPFVLARGSGQAGPGA